MKKFTSITLAILVAIFLFYGCNEKRKVRNSEPSKLELLRGDWVTEKYDHAFWKRQFHINVRDSILTFFSTYSDSVDFTIQGNLLTVYDSTYAYEFGTHQKYHISKLDENNLVLVSKSNKIRRQLRDYGWNSDTLTFRKIQKKNNIKPVSISFSSTSCYGSCPTMKLQIDSKRNVRFFGGEYSEIEGGFSGKINQKIYHSILDQIHNLPLDSLKPEYSASWTDDQSRYLVIHTEDYTLKTNVYGVYNQPVELTILMKNLMDLYKRAQLTEDRQINDSTSFDPYLIMSHAIEIPAMPEHFN